MKSADRKPPKPSPYIATSIKVKCQRVGLRVLTRIPPCILVSNSSPWTGRRDTSADAVISPMASMAKDTVMQCSGWKKEPELEDPTVDGQHRENCWSVYSDPESMNPAYDLRYPEFRVSKQQAYQRKVIAGAVLILLPSI